MIKTFRGLLANSGQDRIRLQTIKGKVGYRITNLQLMTNNNSGYDVESTVQIFKESQTATSTVNFTDSNLLASGYLTAGNQPYEATANIIIFDNEIFNQDIYISHVDDGGNARPCNYLLSLEVIPLDDAGAEYTTLKDMRAT